MKLSVDILEELIEQVYPPEQMAREIDRQVENQISAQVAYEVTVFNVWLHKHRVLDRLRSGEYSLVPHNPVPPVYLRYTKGDR